MLRMMTDSQYIHFIGVRRERPGCIYSVASPGITHQLPGMVRSVKCHSPAISYSVKRCLELVSIPVEDGGGLECLYVCTVQVDIWHFLCSLSEEIAYTHLPIRNALSASFYKEQVALPVQARLVYAVIVQKSDLIHVEMYVYCCFAEHILRSRSNHSLARYSAGCRISTRT